MIFGKIQDSGVKRLLRDDIVLFFFFLIPMENLRTKQVGRLAPEPRVSELQTGKRRVPVSRFSGECSFHNNIFPPPGAI